MVYDSPYDLVLQFLPTSNTSNELTVPSSYIAFSLRKTIYEVRLEPYLLKERVAVGMLMGDNRWAGLRPLNGLDFVNPPLNLTFYNYNSETVRRSYNRALYSLHSCIVFVMKYCKAFFFLPSIQSVKHFSPVRYFHKNFSTNEIVDSSENTYSRVKRTY